MLYYSTLLSYLVLGDEKKRHLNEKANFGRSTTAGLKEWKTEVKKKKREERDQKTCFSSMYLKKGRLWRSLKTEVKTERVKKMGAVFFLKMECNWKQHAAKGQGQE